MPRRQDHRPAELRELAIARVQQHLLSQPASLLSLRQVARDIGYSAGTLINLFGSFSLLLLTTNARTLDDIHSRLVSAMADTRQRGGSRMEELETAALTYAAYARQHPHAWRLIFELHLDEVTPLPEWQQVRISQLFTLLENCLARLCPAADAGSCEQAARVIWAGVHGICTLALDDKLFTSAQNDSQAMIRSLLQHYLHDWCAVYATPASDLNP